MFCCHFSLYLWRTPRNADHRCVRFCWSLLWMCLCPQRFPGVFLFTLGELLQPYTKWSSSELQIVIDQCFPAVLVLKGTGLHKTSETLMTDNVLAFCSSCAQRHKTHALGNWLLPVCHPVLHIESSLKWSLSVFLVLRKLPWPWWNYLQNRKLVIWLESVFQITSVKEITYNHRQNYFVLEPF